MRLGRRVIVVGVNGTEGKVSTRERNGNTVYARPCDLCMPGASAMLYGFAPRRASASLSINSV